MAWDTPAGPLTRDQLERTFEAIKNAPPDPCRLGKHVVSAEAKRRGGWYTCGNCYRPVMVGSEQDLEREV